MTVILTLTLTLNQKRKRNQQRRLKAKRRTTTAVTIVTMIVTMIAATTKMIRRHPKRRKNQPSPRRKKTLRWKSKKMAATATMIHLPVPTMTMTAMTTTALPPSPLQSPMTQRRPKSENKTMKTLLHPRNHRPRNSHRKIPATTPRRMYAVFHGEPPKTKSGIGFRVVEQLSPVNSLSKTTAVLPVPQLWNSATPTSVPRR
mmetsp:Transcript_12184/g.17506  ORF Transcript_12184/g.17506 Transcript_12184/m.17506 type:complete len:201 (-) Transcript_12184:533-1135(-)